MSTSTDAPRVAPTPDGGLAAFEASVLVRCTGVCGGGRARALGGVRARTASVSATATGVERATDGFDPGSTGSYVAEFNRADAAHRLVSLLLRAGRDASTNTYTAGNRHRYEIHRVVAPAGTEEALRAAWQQGYALLCGRLTAPRSARQLRHALQLASAAWRAALLTTGPTRSDSPGLRVADLDTATMLIRAGRMLDLPVRMSTRPGGQLLLVLPVGAPRVRLAEVTSAPVAA